MQNKCIKCGGFLTDIQHKNVGEIIKCKRCGQEYKVTCPLPKVIQEDELKFFIKNEYY